MIIVLLLFIIIDIFLLLKVFGSSFLTKEIYRSKNGMVVVRSELLNRQVSVTKPEFLESELLRIKFWDKNNIILYEQPFIRYVTAKRLIILLTDKPQLLGRERDLKDRKSVVMSYAQSFDNAGQTLTLTIHTQPNIDARYSWGTTLSFYTLRSIIESTKTFTRTPGSDYNVKMQMFLKNYFRKENREFLMIQ